MGKFCCGGRLAGRLALLLVALAVIPRCQDSCHLGRMNPLTSFPPAMAGGKERNKTGTLWGQGV